VATNGSRPREVDDGKRGLTGLAVSIVERPDGKARLVFDNIRRSGSAPPFQWSTTYLYTWIEFDLADLVGSTLDHQYFVNIGRAVVASFAADQKMRSRPLPVEGLRAPPALQAASEKPAVAVPLSVTLPDGAAIDGSDLLVWRQTLAGTEHAGVPSSNCRSNPVIAGQRLLVCTFSPGAVYCLDVADGREIWSFGLDGLGDANVLPLGDVVYAKTARTLYALRLADGQLVWKFTPYAGDGEYLYSAPVVARGRLFLGDRAGSIHCLDASTGVRLWASAVAKGNVNSTFLVVGDRIIAGTNDATVVGVDAANGTIVWRTEVDGPSIHEVLPYGGALVQTTHSLFRISPVDGTVQTHWKWPGERVEQVVVAEDMLVLRLGEEHLIKEHLIGLREDKEVYRRSCPESGGRLSYSATTRRVYDSGLTSLRIIDPATGECLYELGFPYGFPGFAGNHPAVTAEHLYLLTDLRLLIGSSGDVVSLRHPTIG
jgi:putative pyrroloquinoline-quinone binding quinoprotein/PQQ enzyme-like repeat protein